MKVVQVTLKNKEGKDVYTTQVETNSNVNATMNQSFLNFSLKDSGNESNQMGAISLFQELTNSVSQYLGVGYVTKRADYHVTINFPTNQNKPDRSEWLSNYISTEYGSMMFKLYLDVILNETKKKLSWYAIYQLLRLGNIFSNNHCIMSHMVCDDGLSYDLSYDAMVLMSLIDTEAFEKASERVDRLIESSRVNTLNIERESRSIINEEHWNNLVSTLAILGTDKSLSDNSRAFAYKAWRSLGKYRLLPWYSVTEEFLVVAKGMDADMDKIVDPYVFDKYVECKTVEVVNSNGDTFFSEVKPLVVHFSPKVEKSVILSRAADKNLQFDKSFLNVFATRLGNNESNRVPILKEFLQDLPWDENLFLAGGSVVDTIREIISNTNRPQSGCQCGDMDFFILGLDETKKKKTLYIFLEKVQKFFGDRGLYYGVRGGVLTIWFQDSFSIQVIMSSFKDPNNLLDCFDLSCCEALWNGKTILSTQRFVDALNQGKGISKGATLKRILKYNNKGWTIISDHNNRSKLLYNRYTRAPENEIKDLLAEIKYNQVVLPRSPEAARYQLFKRFPELTKDLLAHTVQASNLSVKETMEGICNIILGSTNFDAYRRTEEEDPDVEVHVDKEKSKQINVGSFGKIAWYSGKDYGVKMWFPRMGDKKISFRIDGLGKKYSKIQAIEERLQSLLADDKVGNSVLFLSSSTKSSKYGDQESEFRIRCDESTKAMFLTMVNTLFNDFLRYSNENNLMSASQQRRRAIKNRPQTPMKDFNDLKFEKTSWPQKLLETGFISLKERKWEKAELFFKGIGLKKEKLGFVGEKFNISHPEELKERLPNANISDTPIFESLENFNVTLDLALKVVLMSDEEFIPCLTINSITLYEIDIPNEISEGTSNGTSKTLKEASKGVDC